MASRSQCLDAEVRRTAANSRRYDNCYANSTDESTDYSNAVTQSPTRFEVMVRALDGISRDIVYQICQWGVGTDIGVW